MQTEHIKQQLEDLTGEKATVKNNKIKTHVHELTGTGLKVLNTLRQHAKEITIKRSGKGLTIIAEI